MLQAMANQDLETTNYNGLHTVKFRNGNHRYYIDGSPKPGVTTIMGKVLAKPGLMLWPLNMAMKYLEAKVPHITTEDLEEARKAHVKRRDAGADTGTIVHGLAEQRLLGQELTTSQIEELLEEAARALSAFEQWLREVKPTTISVEQMVYSHTLEYAGTFDSILEIDGKVYLCDLKTTNASKDATKGVYAEYFIQLGAYLYAYEEQRQYELAHGGTNLVQIDDLLVISCRKDGNLNTVSASEMNLGLDDCMAMWQATFLLHNRLGDLNKKLGA